MELTDALRTIRIKQYIRRKRPDKALKELSKIPRTNAKTHTRILNLMGDFYYEYGNKAQAQACWRESLGIQYQQWDVMQKLNRVNSEIAQAQMSRKDERRDEVFLKYVRDEDRHRKTGMNVCLLGANVANNLSALMHALNKYTIHKARCITFGEDYIKRDKDVLVNPIGEAFPEAEEIVKNADFFHFGEDYQNFGTINFADILTPTNCVFQYFGSFLRTNAKRLAEMHRQSDFKAIVWPDWSMVCQLPGSFYHIQKMFDTEGLPCAPPADKVIRIAHAPTRRRIKSTDLFLSIMEELKKKYPVETVLIEGVSYPEAIKIKASAHMTYDQLILGYYATSTLESLAMGHVVFCGLNNFMQSFLPNSPIVSVTESTLRAKIEHFLENPEKIAEVGKKGRAWVERWHHPKDVVQKYVFLYDLIKNGPRIIDDPSQYFLYEFH